MKSKPDILRSLLFLNTLCISLGILYFFESIRPSQGIQQKPQVNLLQREKVENDTEVKLQIENKPKEPERKLKSLSPYDLKNYIDEKKEVSLEEVWDKLDVKNKFYGAVFDDNHKTGFFNFCNTCKAETFQHNLDEDRGTETILKITDGWMYWRYVIFKHIQSEKEEKWKAIGLVDFDLGKYEEPQHFFLLSEGKNFLVIRHQTGSGSGFSEYSDSIFTIVNGELIELLNYPSEGYASSTADQPTTEFTANIKKLSIQSSKAYIDVEYNIDYSGSVDEDGNYTNFLLFQKKYKANYTKNLVNKKLKLKLYDSNKKLLQIGKGNINDLLNLGYSTLDI